MKSVHFSDEIRVLVSLSNLLLSHGVQELLRAFGGKFKVRTSHDTDVGVDFDPDCVIVDERALDSTLHRRWPEAKLILVDNGLSPEEVASILLSSKIHGVIATDTDLPLFIKALSTIKDGQLWLNNGTLKAMLHPPAQRANTPHPERLSRKEREIVLLVAAGCRNREIADRLCMSEQTVKSHLNRVFRKMDITSRVQLVPVALSIKYQPNRMLYPR